MKISKCINCGANLNSTKCEYCKTDHSFQLDLSSTKSFNEGKSIGEIMRKEPSYIDWCVKSLRSIVR